MKKKEIKKVFKLYSNNEILNNLLDKYIAQEKVSKRIYKFLETICNFDDKLELEIYETKDNDKEKYIKVCFFDNNSDLYVICLSSSNKKDLNIIERITNENSTLYDISLSKKFNLTKDNLNYMKTKDIYNFKYGRLITDNSTFYTIYLGDDIGYQIEIDTINDNIDYNNILYYLNKLDNKPTLIDYINIFERIIKEKNILFNDIKIYSFKEYKTTGVVKLNDKQNDLIKKKVF